MKDENGQVILPLYNMLMRNYSSEDIADWMAKNGIRHSNQMLRRTLKKADREDLIEYFIQEVDIKIGDLIKSRMTARIGTVFSIHNDGDTIEVRWDAGGRQLLSKESVFKLRNKNDIKNPSDLKKVTTNVDCPYSDMHREDK